MLKSIARAEGALHVHGPAGMITPARAISALERAAGILVKRLEELERRVTDGDPTAWEPLERAAAALAVVLPQLAPERRGALLTTAQLAERLQIAPKTLLKRKARGEVRPALQKGKLIRWRGDEIGR